MNTKNIQGFHTFHERANTIIRIKTLQFELPQKLLLMLILVIVGGEMKSQNSSVLLGRELRRLR
jgi:hypothetical protein